MSKNRHDELFEFCRTLYPGETPVPLHAPRFLGNEKKYLSECIDSTYVSYVGEFVQRFEQTIAGFVGCKHAVSMCNGTVALHLALVVAGVEPGDEVLVPSLTFVAAANAVSHARGECVFIDSEGASLGMSPDKLESFLKSTAEKRADGKCYNRITKKRIRACLPVHIFGHPARVQELVAICDRFGIVVIEDASESIGSYIGLRHTGTFGRAAVLSFNGNKTLTTGGGGMLLTNDDAFAHRFRHLATTAKRAHPYEFFHDEVAFNYRMPNLNAAVGLAQAETLDQFLLNKRETAAKYREFCRAHGLHFLDEPEGTKANFWLNALILESPDARNELLKAAVVAKVQIRPIWRLMHHLPMYSKNQRTDMATSEEFESRVVNLPSSVTRQGGTF